MMKFRFVTLLVVAMGTMVPLAATAQDNDWLVVPEVDLDAFEPGSPYENNLNLRWTIEAPDCASSIRLVFTSIDIEKGRSSWYGGYEWYDYLQLEDGAGNSIQRIDGAATNFTSNAVPGNSVQLWFRSDATVTRAGYELERVEVQGCRPCELTQCPLGQVCVEQQVVCVRAPCPPVAVCEEPSWCATARCAAGYHCDEEARACLPDETTCEEDRDCPVWNKCNSEGICEGIVCPTLYAPVCGSDGTTYSNSCWADAHHVEVMHVGDCTADFCSRVRCDGYCDEDYDRCVNPCDGHECAEGQHCELVNVVCVKAPCYPVPECRDDAETCEVDSDCPDWQLCNDRGICEPTHCTEQYAPVCGVDGVTYDNDCFAHAHHVEIAHKGACTNDFCAKVLCAPNTFCNEEIDACVDPCADVACEAGQVCELTQIMCFTTPCYPIGMCVDADVEEGDACGSDEDCGDTMVCSGIFHAEEGICLAADSRAVFKGEGGIDIPDNDATGITSTIEATGLWTVPTDIVISLRISHTWRGDLRVTLTDPNGALMVLHNRTGSSANDLVFDAYPVSGNSMDDSVNGTWTLTVSDNARYDTGVLESWSLLLGSRMD